MHRVLSFILLQRLSERLAKGVSVIDTAAPYQDTITTLTHHYDWCVLLLW